MLRTLALCALFLTAACAATPRDITITPTSDVGLVVVAVEPPQDLAEAARYTLVVSQFDPDSRTLPLGSMAGIEAQSAAVRERTYLVGQARPGVYVLSALRVSAWGLCYNGGTVRFDVRPGEVTVVGLFDPNPSLTDLTRAVIRGEVPASAPYNEHHYVFDTPRPNVTNIDEIEGWEEGVNAYLSANFPNVAAPVRAATLEPAIFGTGRSLHGLTKLCGGYYSSSPEADAPAS